MIENQDMAERQLAEKSGNNKKKILLYVKSGIIGVILGLGVILIIVLLLKYFNVLSTKTTQPKIVVVPSKPVQISDDTNTIINVISVSPSSIPGINCSDNRFNAFITLDRKTNVEAYTGTIENIHLDGKNTIDGLYLKSLQGNSEQWFDISNARKTVYKISSDLKISSDNLAIGQTVHIDFTCGIAKSPFASLTRVGIQ